jgi:hypothetical protein
MTRISRCPLLVSLISCALALAACASSNKPKPASPPRVESEHKMVNPLEDDDEIQDGLQVEGTLGQLDQASIQEGLAPHLPRVTACFNSRVGRAPYLSGKIELQFRVARDGALKKLTLLSSSVGHWGVEQCVRKELERASFSRPRGGEAEFTYSLDFQGRYTPLVWDPGMVKDEIAGKVDELLTVKEGREETTLTAPEGLVITFYVNRLGRVVSAGMTASEPIEESFAEAFITNLKKIEFVDPQQRYAKVTHRW